MLSIACTAQLSVARCEKEFLIDLLRDFLIGLFKEVMRAGRTLLINLLHCVGLDGF
jgi:hypothetical protein